MGSCPYALPTSNELLDHQDEFQNFVTAKHLKQRLINLLDTTPDGWIPTDSWEATDVAHKEAFDETVQIVRSAKSIDNQLMSEEHLTSIWPLDIK